MSKFAHLKKLDVSGKTAWMTLDDLEGSPRLCLKFAGQSNHGYYNAMLKRAGGRSRKFLTGKVDVQMILDNQDDDRDLFPAHIVTGWEGIVDEKGKKVKFSRSECKELLDQMPDWIFEKIVTFAKTPEQFLDDGEELAPDAVELAGN